MPLQAQSNDKQLTLLAPNRYVMDQVQSKFRDRIASLIVEHSDNNDLTLALSIGSLVNAGIASGDDVQIVLNPRSGVSVDTGDLPEKLTSARGPQAAQAVQEKPDKERRKRSDDAGFTPGHGVALNPDFVFDSFVEGKSNELAKAAARQVAENAGRTYNPLLLYGGVGLGKTHLMQAVGNQICQGDANAKVVYMHSQQFVEDMVKALQQGTMREFMDYYRSLDALLIDDIQFFANKLRSQEEFFHVFNALLERGQQMVLTCDRYPKEIDGLEERLQSRFVWGLTVAVEPPELETRVAILMNKADRDGMKLSSDVAFFIAERVRSNVRELEGSLRRVIANARFTGREITVDQVRASLRDLFAIQERAVTIDGIQRAVADYYKLKLSDLLSKRRSRSVARPRQIAMSLAKELTRHSLPEIGEQFGGRDHTTVLHACRKVRELQSDNADVAEDYKNLVRILAG